MVHDPSIHYSDIRISIGINHGQISRHTGENEAIFVCVSQAEKLARHTSGGADGLGPIASDKFPEPTG